MELILLFLLAIFAIVYRSNNSNSINGTTKYITKQARDFYEKFAPYSYQQMRSRIKELGEDYSPKQYIRQILIFAGLASVISYLYFYNIIWVLVYATIAILFVPYLSFLKYKRLYSEYIF